MRAPMKQLRLEFWLRKRDPITSEIQTTELVDIKEYPVVDTPTGRKLLLALIFDGLDRGCEVMVKPRQD